MSDVLRAAADHAAAYLESLSSRPLAATAAIPELRRRLARPFPQDGMPAGTVIDELVRDSEGGIRGSGSGRSFGWVIGGALPVALASVREAVLLVHA